MKKIISIGHAFTDQCIESINSGALTYEDALTQFPNNEQVGMVIAKNKPEFTLFFSAKLKNSEAIARVLIETDPDYLCWMSSEIKNNLQLACKLAESSPHKLSLMSEEVQSNPSVLARMMPSILAEKPDLVTNKALAFELVKINPSYIKKYMSWDINGDVNVALELLKKDPVFLEFSHPNIKNSKKIAAELAKIDPIYIGLMSASIRADFSLYLTSCLHADFDTVNCTFDAIDLKKDDQFKLLQTLNNICLSSNNDDDMFIDFLSNMFVTPSSEKVKSSLIEHLKGVKKNQNAWNSRSLLMLMRAFRREVQVVSVRSDQG